MEYFGANNKLSKILKSDKLIYKNFGTKRGAKIIEQLDDFIVADTLEDISYLPPAKLHQLKGNRKEEFAVSIGENWRITFEGYDKKDNLTTNKSQIVTLPIVP